MRVERVHSKARATTGRGRARAAFPTTRARTDAGEAARLGTALPRPGHSLAQPGVTRCATPGSMVPNVKSVRARVAVEVVSVRGDGRESREEDVADQPLEKRKQNGNKQNRNCR